MTTDQCPSFGVCTSSQTCGWGDADNTLCVKCWRLMFAMIATGSFLLIYANILIPNKISLERFIRYLYRRVRGSKKGPAYRRKRKKNKEDEAVAPFVSYKRIESNFCRNNIDPLLELPPPYQGEYKPCSLGSSVEASFLSFFFGDFATFLAMEGGTIVYSAFGWGFVASGFGTFIWLLLYYEDSCATDENGDGDVDTPWLDYFNQAMSVNSAFYAFYVFFPTFMLAGYISFVAIRWRDFMVNCHTIQAKIHNIALTCGMSVSTPVPMETRKRLYKIYRYLSVLHALTYQSVSESIGPLSLRRGDFTRLGLLTMNEIRVLLPMDNKIRDTMLSWLGGQVNRLMMKDAIQPAPVLNILTYDICNLRGICARHHDLFVRDNPNTYVRLLLVVVTLWLASFVVTSPWRMTIYSGSTGLTLGMACFQPYVLFANILLILTINSSIAMVRLLRNPFALTQERINVDNLMASTDRCIFASMRGLFDCTEGEEMVPSPMLPKKEAALSRPSAGAVHPVPLAIPEEGSDDDLSVENAYEQEASSMRVTTKRRKRLTSTTSLADVREI